MSCKNSLEFKNGVFCYSYVFNNSNYDCCRPNLDRFKCSNIIPSKNILCYFIEKNDNEMVESIFFSIYMIIGYIIFSVVFLYFILFCVFKLLRNRRYNELR